MYTRKMPGFLSRKLINFFDTRKTLVYMTANAHFVENYSKGTLELELHTYQKDAFKKVVNFSDRNVGDFFGINIVNFFDTKMEK